MFENFIGKNVTMYLVEYGAYQVEEIKGKLISSVQSTSVLEIEIKKKFGEVKKFQRVVNNGFVRYIDVEIEEEKEEQKSTNE